MIRQNVITFDSLGNDGKYYREMTEFSDVIIDTTTYEVHTLDGEYLLYKLDADSGEGWAVRSDSSLVAWIYDTYEDIFFNHPIIVKIISYYVIFSQDSLWVGNYYLASGFGLVRTDVEFAAPEYFIRGAIIDGILYGTVTSIQYEPTAHLPGKITLCQNYPNPFNPVTTIRYDLPFADQVELGIYDILGREVKKVVNEYQLPGIYTVTLKAEDLPSGFYIYRLKTSREVRTKKMLLTR